MKDVAVPPPLSSFTSYRRKQALAAIAEELERRATRPTPAAPLVAGWADPVGALAGLHRLVDSPDPSLVFADLAELLVPTLCDQATAVVHVGVQATAWQELSPGAVALPANRALPDASGWELTVATPARPAGLEGDVPGPDFVAVLTCRGGGRVPTAQEIALIELAAHHAAAVVHQARQLQLLHQQQKRVGDLLTALDTNRMISAAVGVLIATHQLTYEQAFELLIRTSQTTNRKLATVAQTVLQNKYLPVDR